MKTLETNLQTHLQSSAVKTISTALKITLTNGDIHYWTDNFADLTIDSQSYDSEANYTISDIVKGDGSNVDTLEIGNIIPESVTVFEKVEKGLFEYATIEIFILNKKDVTQIHTDFKGNIARVRKDDFTFNLECEGLANKLLLNVTRTYEFICPLVFGSDRCTFDTDTVSVSSSTTSVTNNKVFIDSSRTEGDDFFRYGIVTWTTGNNSGLTKEVRSFEATSKTFSLMEAMPFDIQIGDAFDVYQGCDKDPDTCKDDFDNFINFQGHLNLVSQASDLTYEENTEE